MIICCKCKKKIKKGRIGICPACGRITCEECMEKEDKELNSQP